MIKFTIITPSHREKLLPKCFEQIDNQTYNSYEHLVALDRPNMNYYSNNTKRKIINCSKIHKSYGNVCRNMLSFYASGDIMVYLDAMLSLYMKDIDVITYLEN